MLIGRVFCIALASYLTLWPGAEIAQTNLSAANQVYQDERVQVTIPLGWKYQPIYRRDNEDRDHRIGVVLSLGAFDLYLLTRYNQASGVIGGRFGEVAPYAAPWLKSDDPWSCRSAFKTAVKRVSQHLVRVDLTLDRAPRARSNDPDCQAMQRQISRKVWAGAYFGSFAPGDNRPPGYFIDIPLETDTNTVDNQMVFAASFRTTDPGKLPPPSDARLRSFLVEADKVVAGIRYK